MLRAPLSNPLSYTLSVITFAKRSRPKQSKSPFQFIIHQYFFTIFQFHYTKITPMKRVTKMASTAVNKRNKEIQKIAPRLRRPSQVTGAVETPRRQYSSSCGGVWCTLWAAGDSMIPLFCR